MSNQNRQTLKQYFQTGSTPTQDQFADLIDSGLNQVDDSITCDANGQIGIGNSAPSANLNVRGRLFTPLLGTLSVANGATTAVGTGTSFDKEIASGDAIQIGAQRFTIASVTDATHLELATAPTSAITNVVAFRDANLLLIENGNGDAQFVIDKSGNVGVGTDTPTAKLHVNGKVVATELAGEGSGITNLSAANIEGTLTPAQLPALTAEQIPNLPASKITTGQLKPDQLPALTPAQIPDLPASKITGLPTSPDNEWIGELQQTISVEGGNVGIGTAAPEAKLDISGSVDGGVVLSAGAVSGAMCSVNFAGHLELRQYADHKKAYFQARDDSDPSAIGLVIRVQYAGAAGEQRYSDALIIDEKSHVGLGTNPSDAQLQVPGIVRADQFEGSGAGITGIQATNLTGQLNAEQIPPIHAAQIADKLTSDQIISLAAEKITGKLSPAQLPPTAAGATEISASNITGVLNAAQLPPISEISGQVTLDQIPTLPPSKISGAVASQSVGPGGRPLLASGTINPGSSQNVYAIPMTELVGGPLAGAYSLEIYTIYLWVAFTDLSGSNTAAYNVMTRSVLAGTASIVGDNPLQIEPLSMGPTQTNHTDAKFPAVTCSVVSGTQQAWLQISTTAGDPTLTVPPSQFSTPLQYYVYSLM